MRMYVEACEEMIEIRRIMGANYCAVLEPFCRGVLSLLIGETRAAWLAKLLAMSSAMTHVSGLLLARCGGTDDSNKMSCAFA